MDFDDDINNNHSIDGRIKSPNIDEDAQLLPEQRTLIFF